MANNPVGWFEIYVQDMSRAKGFYESVFSTRLERLEGPGIEMWALFVTPDDRALLALSSRWRAFRPAATAPLFTSLAQTVRSRQSEPLRAAGRFLRKNFLSVSTDLLP